MPSACARSKPTLRARGADAGDPGQVAIPGAVEDVEALSAEPVQRQPLRDPRRQAEHAGDVRVRRDPDRDGAAHRESDEERRAGNEVERGAPIGHARVERIPRLEPVAHLDEGQLREAGGQLGREQLAGGAPRARHGAGRASVERGSRREAQPRSRGARRRHWRVERFGSLRSQVHGGRARSRRRGHCAGSLTIASLVAVQVIAGEPVGVCLDHRGPFDEPQAMVRLGGLAQDVVERVVRLPVAPDRRPDRRTGSGRSARGRVPRRRGSRGHRRDRWCRG